ncbi:DUF3995 domain-containing protein [Kitasatospora cheerisanensis]|uniref:DUF3995 domain-containing protein n=1 Tax=Kitasatospora cheerisanensis KCTC 2395 TaxID=1348663 RepID=A0A066Z6G5_9ACTN|nr:DUF3995 domain-containing protein [Kitasatospora cheerisanensis]KDN85735.1 hypothetical protein KCH_23930 [Kitasatospora cheerisanensis KCTC 2395]
MPVLRGRAAAGADAAPDEVGRGVRVTAAAVAGTLAAVGALHLVWARSPWPCRDRERFAELVVGVGPEQLPSAGACLGVAGLLGAAAGLVGSRGGVLPPVGPRRLRTAGAAAVAGVLLARGLAGPVAFARRSPAFVRLDRRLYAPLCLALGTGAAAVAAKGR